MADYSKGISLIKSFEGVRLKAYKALPTETYYTIGWGHYGADVSANMTITMAQADALLETDLKKYMSKVEKYNSKYHWTDNEASALLSFCYNVGSIDQLTANGTRSKSVIADKMLLYNKSGGKAIVGLTRRRQEEHDLFLEQSNTTSSSDKSNEDTSVDNIRTYSLMRDGNNKIAEHFKVKEFRCKDGSDKILIDTNFVITFLEDIRTHFNAPVTINSAYRTPEYNAKIGGAKSSYHMQGRAFDIVVKGHTPAEVANYAISIGVNGVIRYNTFVHVDSRDSKYHAVNYK